MPAEIGVDPVAPGPSGTETVIVYRGEIFRYPRGDAAGWAQAGAHGRTQGVPDDQLDWPV